MKREQGHIIHFSFPPLFVRPASQTTSLLDCPSGEKKEKKNKKKIEKGKAKHSIHPFIKVSGNADESDAVIPEPTEPRRNLDTQTNKTNKNKLLEQTFKRSLDVLVFPKKIRESRKPLRRPGLSFFFQCVVVGFFLLFFFVLNQVKLIEFFHFIEMKLNSH